MDFGYGRQLMGHIQIKFKKKMFTGWLSTKLNTE
jgi:hypothetical protein